ncbi:integrase [Gossypium australe]|uniref:Integrase n=1 Tax=Gossypium australe TaxID=47621 RepID=A0A5B6VXV1_9ROSI|nr:integrase [Gossypium australe]
MSVIIQRMIWNWMLWYSLLRYGGTIFMGKNVPSMHIIRRHWIELLKDYDCTIEYHPGKGNVVVDALSRKSMSELSALFARLSVTNIGGLLAELQVRPTLIEEIIFCVPSDFELRQSILREAHSSLYAMHPGRSKMDRDLCEQLKRDVTDFVARCLTCQQVKVEHQFPSGLLQPIQVPQWKWECITMYFVSGLLLTLSKKDSSWVIVDRLMKSTHFLPMRTDYLL